MFNYLIATNLRIVALEATLRVSKGLQCLCRKRSWTSQNCYHLRTIANIDTINTSIRAPTLYNGKSFVVQFNQSMFLKQHFFTNFRFYWNGYIRYIDFQIYICEIVTYMKYFGMSQIEHVHGKVFRYKCMIWRIRQMYLIFNNYCQLLMLNIYKILSIIYIKFLQFKINL